MTSKQQQNKNNKNKRSPENLPELYPNSAKISPDFRPNFYIGNFFFFLGGGCPPPPLLPFCTPMFGQNLLIFRQVFFPLLFKRLLRVLHEYSPMYLVIEEPFFGTVKNKCTSPPPPPSKRSWSRPYAYVNYHHIMQTCTFKRTSDYLRGAGVTSTSCRGRPPGRRYWRLDGGHITRNTSSAYSYK